MLIKKRKNTVPPWKIFILTVVGFGLMLAIAVHSRNEALNRLSQEYTITDDAKPRHIKFESMPVGEAEQAVGMYLRYNAMVQFEESGKILSDDLAKNVPFDSMQADFENGIIHRTFWCMVLRPYPKRNMGMKNPSMTTMPHFLAILPIK